MVNKDIFWIRSPRFDFLWIIGPHFYSVILAFLIYPFVQDSAAMPLWVWFALVLGIDVSHVYSTIFRVYLDKSQLQRYQLISWLIPLIVWVLGVLLYSLGSSYFWRGLAYLAVFHFIRQQYGFFRIYSGKTKVISVFQRIFNQYSIYFITLIPVIIWHVSGPKSFNWFIDGDFLYIPSSMAYSVLNGLLVFFICLYIASEIYQVYQTKQFNLAKNSFYVGTLLVWYVGIVYFNDDIIFTLTNVVAHGIPYMALVWNYKTRHKQNYSSQLFKSNNLLFFLIVLFLLAYLEEFLWAVLVWKDHLAVFFVKSAQLIDIQPVYLAWIVPLLAVPQGTHYILDAFIWKIRDSDRNQWMIEGHL